MLAHRFSWILANGKIPDNLSVLHNCPGGDNPACVNPDHLFLGTQLDNGNDAARKKRFPYGEKHFFAKLKNEDVREIRRRAAAGESQKDLAKEYGISDVWHIVHRKKWKNVD